MQNIHQIISLLNAHIEAVNNLQYHAVNPSSSSIGLLQYERPDILLHLLGAEKFRFSIVIKPQCTTDKPLILQGKPKPISCTE